jgi:hypothetical protein
MLNVEEFCRNLASQLTQQSAPALRLETTARELARFFTITPDEVALFTFDANRQTLVLRWPASHKTVGNIPLAAANCLAAKTAREQQATCDNNFATTPHLHLFEHLLSSNPEREPIQKIICAPLLDTEELRGVVQIARKGKNQGAAGPDFTAEDLVSLNAIASILSEHLV